MMRLMRKKKCGCFHCFCSSKPQNSRNDCVRGRPMNWFKKAASLFLIHRNQIIKTLFIVVSITALFIIYTYNSFVSVSRVKKTVYLNSINSNETVLAVRYKNDAWTHTDNLMVVNKRKQCKLIDLSHENVTDSKLLNYMDKKLRDDSIEYMLDKVTISEKLMSEVINIDDYNLKKEKSGSVDQGNYYCYSVCGSGANRKLVLMKIRGDRNAHCNVRKFDSICDNLISLYSKSENKISNNRNREKSVDNPVSVD